MKKLVTKNSMLICIITVLAAMNIATLATILYHVKSSKTDKAIANGQGLDIDTEKFSGRYFRDSLDLSGEQMDKFREFNHGFRQKAYELTEALSQKRIDMLDELNKNKPDTTKLNSLSVNIGAKHAQLKVLTYQYYLDIKNICTPEQQITLNKLFQTMFQNDSRMGFPGKTGHRGQGMGKGSCRNK